MNPNRHIESDYIKKSFNKELNDIKKERKLKEQIKPEVKSPADNLIEIYTDGSCSPNPGKGSYAFLALHNAVEIIRSSGYAESSTNNKMELTAPTKALEWLLFSPLLNDKLKVIVYSDSVYVVNGITSWIQGWIKKNFAGVKNKEEWLNLNSTVQLIGINIKWEWVKGHNGNDYTNLFRKVCQTSL